MKRTFTVVFALICSAFIAAQVKYESFESRQLNSVRKIKIKLPKDYDENSSVMYPVVVVFDGDYLFEPVAGQTDFQTYFDDMPSSIIVGVMHEDVRFYDTYSDEVSGLPIEFGAHFYEFIGQELLPYLDINYNTSKFRVAVGHDLTANFINSFLLKDNPLFQAYVNVSPDFVGNMDKNVIARAEWVKQDIIYYMATAKSDIKHIRSTVLNTHNTLESIENPHFTYYFDDFEEAAHYTMVTRAISRAFDKIFDIYRPIRDKEIEEKVITFEGTLDNYIIDRYKKIEDLFGIIKPISEEEFQKIAAAAEEREDSKSLEKLGKLVNTKFPKSNLGTYYLALHAEKEGKTKKARKLYESALAYEDGVIIDKDFIMSKVEDLEMTENNND